MSDRFDITLERKLESSADRAEASVAGVRRIEVITGAERRRRWSEADKVRIVVESFRPGANVSEVARLNGLSPQQLFAWRREARALFRDGDTTEATPAAKWRSKSCRAQTQAADNDAPAFAPVVLAACPPSPPPGPPSPPTHPAGIEIAIADAVVRVIGQVETATLIAVLRAVRRAS